MLLIKNFLKSMLVIQSLNQRKHINILTSQNVLMKISSIVTSI
uniref:Uncharacterized protein n=1 Tax=virus sp. ctmTa7 TaxID=2828255 RepID=A0A8S5RC33_9VIRU|nr:MAG TPA: hypothetical protein [virus sp. ctmTa7]